MWHTDSDEDGTHTDNRTGVWTHHEWVQPVWQLCKQMQETTVPSIRKKVYIVWIQHCLKEARQWLMTGDSCVCWNWYDKSLLHTLPVSVAVRIRTERKQRHPSTSTHLLLHDTLQHWGRQMTHSALGGIPGIWASNRQTQYKDMLQTCQELVCDKSVNTDPSRYYSDLNFLILLASQT